MEQSIFAMEICARIDHAPDLLPALRQRILDHPHAVGLQDKWEFYSACVADLLAAVSSFERGCWDFFDDDARAKRDFKMWTAGMTTEEGARTSPSTAIEAAYRGGEPRFLTFTMSFVLIQATETEIYLSQLCTVRDADLWKRSTFVRILEGLKQLSFASILGDVVYLIPRDDGWALTEQDLSDPKFEYLRTIEE